MAGCQEGPGTPSRLDVKSGEAGKKVNSRGQRANSYEQRYLQRSIIILSVYVIDQDSQSQILSTRSMAGLTGGGTISTMKMD